MTRQTLSRKLEKVRCRNRGLCECGKLFERAPTGQVFGTVQFNVQIAQSAVVC